MWVSDQWIAVGGNVLKKVDLLAIHWGVPPALFYESAMSIRGCQKNLGEPSVTRADLQRVLRRWSRSARVTIGF